MKHYLSDVNLYYLYINHNLFHEIKEADLIPLVTVKLLLLKLYKIHT